MGLLHPPEPECWRESDADISVEKNPDGRRQTPPIGTADPHIGCALEILVCPVVYKRLSNGCMTKTME